MDLDRKWLLYLAVTVLAVSAGLFLGLQINTPSRPPISATVLPVPRPLPPLDLRDQDNHRVTNEQLKGHWSFLFLGYTHCPDICPSTLNDLKRTAALLAAPGPAPRVYFVSVDPKRDTPARLKDYVHFYNPDFVGVTGEISQLRALASALSSTFFYEPANQTGNYTVGHPAAVFLIDPQGRLAAIFMPPLLASSLAADFRAIVAMEKNK